MDPIPGSPCVYGKRLRTDPVSKLLGDDHLLIEIIAYLGLPTTWLRHAFDPTFLRRFYKLHPPCILILRRHRVNSEPLSLRANAVTLKRS